MHELPQLRKLEQKYPDTLLAIHVHSAKFPAEQLTANLRQAVIRYDVRSPVVNDAEFQVWQQWAVRAWPTLFLVDPEGKIIAKQEGETRFEDLDRAIARLLPAYAQRGVLRPGAIPGLQPETTARGPLAYPGKILADETAGRLFISDSNHDRIVVASLDGGVQDLIGAGVPGLEDGSFPAARFNRPQGLALHNGLLYVADTENHALREVDLAARTVRTIAGTGDQAFGRTRGGPGLSVSLSSPWDLAPFGNQLFVAMAGLHQIWSYDLAEGTIHPFAGAGPEGLQDGTREQAWFAQPSGLAAVEGRLYVADSETSAIRAVDTARGGLVWTIVGIGLFEFGDRDGIGHDVRLQHPLGLCWAYDVLWVADSYNHKIKLLEPGAREVRSYLGSGEPGSTNGPGPAASFHEPAGLTAAFGRLYIADTNNGLIRVADVATGEVSTLALRGV